MRLNYLIERNAHYRKTMPVAVDPLNPNRKGKPKLPLSNLFAVAV
jgi:hypothetical protein